MDKNILFLVLITTFLQVLHCFEEIKMGAIKLIPKLKNKMLFYLLVASVLIGINFFVAIMLLFDVKYAYYFVFYTVLISVGNSIIHIIDYIKTKSYRGTLGARVFSGIPLGISGIILCIHLIKAFV